MTLTDGNSAQAEAEDYMARRRMRALGGGGSVERAVTGPPSIQKLREQAGGHLTKKDVANQRADTMRLLNRLRLVSPNADPNNYVVSTNTSKKEMHASRAGTPGYRPRRFCSDIPNNPLRWTCGRLAL